MATTNIKPANLRQLSQKEELFTPGHRLCPGCAEGTVVRQVLHATDYPVVVANATGCLEVTSSLYPFSNWRAPWLHSAFENTGATVGGIEAAYKSLRKQGKIPDEEIRFVAFGGDGGTYDIGLQSLSGALERGHNFLYVCLDNGAYMNTGIQRSGATPFGAWTTTSPAGKAMAGKSQRRKDLTAVAAAHGIPYVAQASPSHWRDLITKAQKAFEAGGPAFINVLTPCIPGWGIASDQTIDMARQAVENCYWPLFEIENGKLKVTVKPREKKPVMDWLKAQVRFRHLFAPANEWMLEQIQADIDARWEKLLKESEE